MKTNAWAVFLSAMLVWVLLGAGPAAAQESARELRAEVRALQTKIALMEKRMEVLEKLKRTFAGFMPEFSERFHVLHAAGDQQDWAVAKHELAELKRLAEVAKAIDPRQGQLFQGFLTGPLHALEKAVDHGKAKPFRAALVRTVESCNKCHVAVGSPFIKVALDIPMPVTARHPHIYGKSKVMAGDSHKH